MKVVDLINAISNDAPVEKTLQDIIAESLIPQGIAVPKPDIVFGINGVPIFTKRSISVLIGRAKSGKTTVTSWIASQSIDKEIKVLWIDTEQGLYYGSRTQDWILRMSGLAMSTSLQFYDLKIFNPNERIAMIEEIIKMYQPDLVIVDGIRDLVFDINNPEEATKRTGDLMRWAEVYNTHILTILHQNKGNDHARGHLGTEMINKSESVIKVEQSDDKLIVCSPEYTRSAPFIPFAFSRDEHGMPVLVEGFSGVVSTDSERRVSGRPRTTIDPTDSTWNAAHQEIVDHIFSKSQFLKYEDVLNNIIHYFKKHGTEMKRNNANEFAVHYSQEGIIWKNPHIKGYAKYEKNPQWKGFPNSQTTVKVPFSLDDDDQPPF